MRGTTPPVLRLLASSPSSNPANLAAFADVSFQLSKFPCTRTRTPTPILTDQAMSLSVAAGNWDLGAGVVKGAGWFAIAAINSEVEKRLCDGHLH